MFFFLVLPVFDLYINEINLNAFFCDLLVFVLFCFFLASQSVLGVSSIVIGRCNSSVFTAFQSTLHMQPEQSFKDINPIIYHSTAYSPSVFFQCS